MAWIESGCDNNLINEMVSAARSTTMTEIENRSMHGGEMKTPCSSSEELNKKIDDLIDISNSSKMKICTQCKIEKEESEFYKRTEEKDKFGNSKFRDQCKSCISDIRKKEYKKNKQLAYSRKMCGIYKITSPTGKIYIGQSYNIPATWKCRYQKPSNEIKCKDQPKIYNSLIKYGWEAHKFEIIKNCPEKDLNHYEMYYIQKLNTYHSSLGMNCTIGGDGFRGIVWSEESKKKQSEKRKKKYIDGYISPIKGILWSDERKKKLSKSKIGRFCGKNNHFYGKKHNAESLKLIGEKSKNRYFSTEARKKISDKVSGEKNGMYGVSLCGEKNGHFGKKHTQQAIELMSKLILNTENGIFYYGVRSAADSIGCSYKTLGFKLNGKRKNNTAFIYI